MIQYSNDTKEFSYSKHILSGRMLEASREILLQRQHVGNWLEYLGVTENDQNSSQSPSSSLADICGGTGAISRWLVIANPSITITVIDNDSDLLKLGKSLLEKKTADRFKFVCADACALSMKEKSVDCSFIHGALHLLKDGKQTLAEMVRISRKRVTIFCSDMNYVAPLERKSDLTPYDKKISEIERTLFYTASCDYATLSLPREGLSTEQVPKILNDLGCENVLVRGIMETVNFDELKPEEFQSYRKTETEELINRAKHFSRSAEYEADNLIELYNKRYQFLIKEHRQGRRRHDWTGGPIVVWIGIIA